MQNIEERFSSLEESNRILSGDVQALNATMRAVNELQAQQRKTAQRAEETHQAVEEAKKESAAREVRTRNVVKWGGFVLAIVLPLVSLLVYVSLLNHVNDLLADMDRDRLRTCQVRNNAVLIHVQRELLLAQVEKGSPEVAEAHRSSAENLTKTLIDCNKVYGG